MKQIQNLLVPTDLTENSRRGLKTACDIAIENCASITILHVARDLQSFMVYSEFLEYQRANDPIWPIDRIVREAHLDLNHFLEPHLALLKRTQRVTKRVVLGAVSEQITKAADEERSDLIVMSPRRGQAWRHYFGGSITDRVTRNSPCPVLSVLPPMPSRDWRGKRIPASFSWPRPRTAGL